MVTKHGNMWFFRIGRFGGSFYLAKRKGVPPVSSTRGKAIIRNKGI